MGELHSWIAIAIAVLSLFFTWYGLRQNKLHQIKSVIPKLSFIRSASDEQSSASITISNEGIGPAIIKEINFFFEGKKLEYTPENIINKVLSLGITCGSSQHKIRILERGSYIKAGNSEFTIIYIAGDKGKDKYDSLYKVICKFNFIIRYEDVYENSFIEELNKDIDKQA